MIRPDSLEDSENAPGGRAAIERGCTCSVLANAAFRTGSGDEPPLVEPGCPIHAHSPLPGRSPDSRPEAAAPAEPSSPEHRG